MHTRVYEYWVAATPEEVWAFHSNPSALETLSQPGTKVSIRSNPGAPENGQLIEMRVWLIGILPFAWNARISQVTPPYGFTDQAEKSPFKFWRHRHDFIPENGGTRIREIVAYILPGRNLGKAMHRWLLRDRIDQMFEHRRKVMQSRFGGPKAPGSLPEGVPSNRQR